MTRINLVDPVELTDQHLFAEFREIKMVPKSLNRSLQARGLEGISDTIPREFTLNAGHVCFFYDKGLYLFKRFDSLKTELRIRNFNIDQESSFDADGVFAANMILYQDWKPTPVALSIIRARIAEKIAMKPLWYRYYGGPYIKSNV